MSASEGAPRRSVARKGAHAANVFPGSRCRSKKSGSERWFEESVPALCCGERQRVVCVLDASLSEPASASEAPRKFQ
ncbi:hypothetical protein Q31a_34890 [Aureliella helgolandensis]|uniref:Uncharacterized protein n=1 Tax=Aureliella helgolandensis TaxID=2527968 RepID=A0A518G996_9BACT|nr:hypothetical protein Q31a_34890 [Aureliella helgolandensis]